MGKTATQIATTVATVVVIVATLSSGYVWGWNDRQPAVPVFIHMSDDERAACATADGGCSVWTNEELMDLAKEIFARGVNAAQRRNNSL